MHLTQASKYQIKHLMQQIMILVQVLLGATFSYFFLKYSKASLIICIMAMMAAPKAMEPVW